MHEQGSEHRHRSRTAGTRKAYLGTGVAVFVCLLFGLTFRTFRDLAAPPRGAAIEGVTSPAELEPVLETTAESSDLETALAPRQAERTAAMGAITELEVRAAGLEDLAALTSIAVAVVEGPRRLLELPLEAGRARLVWADIGEGAKTCMPLRVTTADGWKLSCDPLQMRPADRHVVVEVPVPSLFELNLEDALTQQLLAEARVVWEADSSSGYQGAAQPPDAESARTLALPASIPSNAAHAVWVSSPLHPWQKIELAAHALATTATTTAAGFRVTSITARLERAGSIELHQSLEDELEVRLDRRDRLVGNVEWRTVRVGRDADERVDDLLPGDYELRVVDERGGLAATLRVTVAPNDVLRVDLDSLLTNSQVCRIELEGPGLARMLVGEAAGAMVFGNASPAPPGRTEAERVIFDPCLAGRPDAVACVALPGCSFVLTETVAALGEPDARLHVPRSEEIALEVLLPPNHDERCSLYLWSSFGVEVPAAAMIHVKQPVVAVGTSVVCDLPAGGLLHVLYVCGALSGRAALPIGLNAQPLVLDLREERRLIVVHGAEEPVTELTLSDLSVTFDDGETVELGSLGSGAGLTNGAITGLTLVVPRAVRSIASSRGVAFADTTRIRACQTFDLHAHQFLQ